MTHNPESGSTHETQPVEIERKFLIEPVSLQDLHVETAEAIRQGYMVVGADGSEARLRDRAGVYSLTVKSKGDLSRGEFETELSYQQFVTLWPCTEGKRLEKTRYTVPYGEHTIELDVYEGRHSGLYVAEVEFTSEAEAAGFTPPTWFAEEVTSNRQFKNQSLALQSHRSLSPSPLL